MKTILLLGGLALLIGCGRAPVKPKIVHIPATNMICQAAPSGGIVAVLTGHKSEQWQIVCDKPFPGTPCPAPTNQSWHPNDCGDGTLPRAMKAKKAGNE